MARNAEPSAARNAIILANIVGFGCVALMDVWGVFTGGARPIAEVFLASSGPSFAPAWYPWFCVGFDLFLGGYIAGLVTTGRHAPATER